MSFGPLLAFFAYFLMSFITSAILEILTCPANMSLILSFFSDSSALASAAECTVSSAVPLLGAIIHYQQPCMTRSEDCIPVLFSASFEGSMAML